MFTAAGKSAAVSAANYIEDVFSTYLYTGTGATQTITNGIDLTGKGGLVWLKKRSSATGGSHRLMDTVRGGNKLLSSNTTGAESTSNQVTFLSSGFNVIDAVDNAATYVSWTFREQAKFFDVVTYTGNGAASRNINHNLGSTPGCIICKATSISDNWGVYHRSTGANGLYLNATNSAGVTLVPTGHTSTTFEVADGYGINNANGVTYVAYLFAHDAGGFGATGSDNVISCGSFTSDGSGNATINLGYEPQWILLKTTSVADSWYIYDNMRGITAKGTGSNAFNAYLNPNNSDAESTTSLGAWSINSTGFEYSGGFANRPFIYIAIRRGPMKTPTSGTSVFSPVAYTGNGANNRAITTGFVPDMVWWKSRSNGTDWKDATLLVGTGRALTQNTTDPEGSVAGYYINTYNNTGFTYGTSDSSYNTNTWTYVVQGFSRAPGFFDVVCYTGTGANRTVTHNLGVVPELMIVKCRDLAGDWTVWQSSFSILNRLRLNTTQAVDVNNTQHFGGTLPTSSVFYVGSTNSDSGALYVAYLFASCPGVSKVGSYTGTGALQTINCGFAAGARFVLIKRTDSTGDWWVYDSARGITSGNDPYILLNSAAAEVTSTNYVDTASTGFQVTAAAPAGLNANGGTYIFLAIA